MLTTSQIERILPHRYPFLLVDRILELSADHVVGLKNVTANEPYFEGHFPGYPLMPGVIIIEAMAQVAGTMVVSRPEFHGHVAYFAAIDSARFRRPITPGDQLRIEMDLVWVRRKIARVRGLARVDGEVAAEAEMTFSFMPLEALVAAAGP